ncbi:MAG TPA: HAD-IB family hydrolase [Acidimicrobiales bacterium]
MTAAAFFDLDRTLVRGATGPALGEALRQTGVIERGPVPGESLVYRLFDLVGETWPTMMLTRQAVRLVKGQRRSLVQEAGRLAAERLTGIVQPFARPLLDEHRRAGRAVVMATTTPIDMIGPLADLLGFDDVVATTYGVDGDERYDGTIDGEFVWGSGKLRAVRAWCDAHGVALDDSWAYSDSFYDLPLLGAVGHPVAVNPDLRLQAMATLRRWPIVHLDVPAGVAKLPVVGLELQKLLMLTSRPELFPYMRLHHEGAENVPESGPAIVAANHRSYFDPLALGLALAGRGRPLRFLAKREMFDAPVVGPAMRALGAIPVDRGSGSDRPLEEAAAALAAGELVAILPQGTIPRGRDFFDPELKGRPGVARLAAMTRAPVVPVGVWGTERVWPRSERIPRVWNVAAPPRVEVRIGPPVELKYRSPTADARRVMAAIADLLPAEARQRREPTPEELALTFPPGHREGPTEEREPAGPEGSDDEREPAGPGAAAGAEDAPG